MKDAATSLLAETRSALSMDFAPTDPARTHINKVTPTVFKIPPRCLKYFILTANATNVSINDPTLEVKSIKKWNLDAIP